MEEKLKHLLDKLPKWQHNILDFLLQTEEEYQEFMNHYYSKYNVTSSADKPSQFGSIYRAMQDYRLKRIEHLNLSFEEFVILFNEDPYKGLITLFQHGLSKSQLINAQKRLSSGEHSLKKYYEYIQYKPEQFLHRILTLKLDDEHMNYLKRRHNQKIEPYEEQYDTSNTALETYYSTAKTNQRLNQVTFQRLIRDTKMSQKIKKLYNGICQLCKCNLKSVNNTYITEAHHIRPYNKTHRGDDTFLNLIVLCPNCHSRFDDFYFAVHPETNIVHCVNPEDELHFTELHMESGHVFGRAYLEYSWEIFSQIKGMK